MKYFILSEMTAEKLGNYRIPLIHSDEFGHDRKNHPLPLNTRAVLDLSPLDEARLTAQTNN